MSVSAPLTERFDARELDRVDPLRDYRDRFIGTEANAEPGMPQAYFDGNSLGRPLRATAENIDAFIRREWGGRLIRAWDERWMELPFAIGDALGDAALGAGPGQTMVGDSTTVLLYKLMRAAAELQLQRDPNRTELLIDTDNFPTDRYLAAGIAAELGMTVRWIDVPREAGVSLDLLQAELSARSNLVVLSHVAYRSGYRADVPALTDAIHAAGALVVWDECHSVGSVPIELDNWGVDIAVGCSYKYLNGGPGAPGWAYVRRELQAELDQPIHGWMGHADVFAMGPNFQPGHGMRRFISGTPSILGMLAMQDTVALIAEVGIQAIREKSIALTEYAIALSDAWLSPLGAELASPRDAERRGGHVTVSHSAMREVNARLWAQDVISDYRDPGGLRIGLAPLSTSFEELWIGMHTVQLTLRDVIAGN